MMKLITRLPVITLVFASLLLFPSTLLNAQDFVYLDAMSLADAFNKNNKQEFYQILSRYVPDQNNLTTTGDSMTLSEGVKKNIDAQSNPILKEYSDLLELKVIKNPSPPEEEEVEIDIAFPVPPPTQSSGNRGSAGIGGVGWTTVADGVSKFIVGRVKEEIMVSFFDRLQRDFNESKELKTLFPTTKQYLGAVKDYNIGLMIEVMRDAFQKDLNRLPQNLPKLSRVDPYKTLIKNNPKTATTIAAAGALTYLIDQAEHPIDVINKMVELDYIDQIGNPNMERSLKTLAFISKSLQLDESSWMHSYDFDILESEPSAPILFMGLILQKNGDLLKDLNITPRNLPIDPKIVNMSGMAAADGRIGVKKIIDAYQLKHNSEEDNYHPLTDSVTYSTYYIFKPLFKDFIRLKEDVEGHLNKIKARKESGDKPSFDEINDYAKTFLNLFSLVIRNTTFGAPESANTFTTIAPALLDLRESIAEKRYGSSIIYLNILLAAALPEDVPVKEEILKYGLFIANVANAQNSDEVHRAIEAIALPTGSSAIKKRAKTNVSLNAYAGPFIAGEHLLENTASPWGTAMGLTAPLGVAISKGLPNDKGSLTLFTSLIDLGAIVTFRFQDDQAQILPEFTLQNIVSPGAYLIYGIPRLPLALGAGIQYGPQLRKIDVNGTTIDSGAYRVGMFLAVDIPVLNFYTETR